MKKDSKEPLDINKFLEEGDLDDDPIEIIKSVKKCKFCAEEIKEDAIKCKHCGSDLDEDSVDEGEDDEDEQIEEKKPANKFKLFLVVIVWSIIIIALASNIFPKEQESVNNSKVFYTQVVANVRSCQSVTCDSLGTYSVNTDLSLPYKNFDELPEWISLSLPDSKGLMQTGYINKITLGENKVETISESNNDATPQTITKENNSISKEKTPKEIVSEWRKSAAYIICYWNYSNGVQYQAQSGSGLVAIFNSVPTIITNKHVTVDSKYGAANECDVRFPDDNGYYVYNNNTPNPKGGYFEKIGNLTVDSNGYDVSYITGLNFYADSISTQSPNISMLDRSVNSSHICKDKLSTGDPVLIIGYPSYGTQMASVLNSKVEPTATNGFISGKDQTYYTTDAKIEHGNSGGLAIDKTNDCYFGIPTASYAGSIESLGRILPTLFFLH